MLKCINTRAPSLARVLHEFGISACIFFIFILIDKETFLYAFKGLNITPWNPSAGFSIFIIARFGNVYSVLIFVARIVSDVLVRHETVRLPILLAGAFIIVSGYVLMARLFRTVVRLDVTIPAVKTVGAMVVSVLFFTSLTSAAYVLMLFAADILNYDDLVASWLRRYVGDIIGILTVVPALLVLSQCVAEQNWKIIRPDLHNLLQGAVILGIILVLFGIESIDEFRFFYVLFLPITWISMQGGFSAAAFGVLWTQAVLITVITILGTYNGTAATEIQILMITLAVTGLVLGAVVSERRAAEVLLIAMRTELNEVGRRAASGELASVIAHELNQPLTAIVNYARSAYLLWQRGNNPTLIDETLSKTIVQANRAAEIVRRLRDFIGRGKSAPVVFSMNELLAEVLKLSTPSLKTDGIELKVVFAEELTQVFADKVQISQVIDNLIRNAIDAMVTDGNKRQRVMSVKTASDELGSVRVSIGDTGPGISIEIADHLFRPFVTTKNFGMGLGLAICKTIINAHDGKLWHEPAVEGGTVFIFTLPAYLGEQEDDFVP